jgi:hypothetical protein
VPKRLQVDNTMVKALARAFRWRKLMETGVYATVDEIATAEKINDSYVSRVLRLTLLALNLLYPKLVGSRVHLNPLVVTIALMFWGTLWGAIGLVFAIPITAGVKAVCDNVAGTQSYGKLLGD